MSIDPDTDYDSLTFYGPKDNQPLWTIKGTLSGDLVAGILVAINLMLDDLVLNFGETMELVKL